MSRSTNETKLIMDVNPQSPISEAYRNLKTNVQFIKWDRTIQIIAVASTLPGEGKTTTISNLAISYAQEGKKVLLIDADLRHPSLHRAFNVVNKVGLSNVLACQKLLAEVVKDSSIENLSIIPSGPVPPNPAELLASPQFNMLLEESKSQYDMILFDTPPILAVADGLIISAACDGVILVVQSGKVKRQMIKKTKAKLEHVNAEILGVVLNNQKKRKNEFHYYN